MVKTQKIDISESYQVLKNCISLNIDYNLIKELHYLDLQNLIISFKIDNTSQILTQLRKNKLKQKGIDKVVEASADDYKNL